MAGLDLTELGIPKATDVKTNQPMCVHHTHMALAARLVHSEIAPQSCTSPTVT